MTVFKRGQTTTFFLLCSGATTAYKFLTLKKRPMRELQYSSHLTRAEFNIGFNIHPIYKYIFFEFL